MYNFESEKLIGLLDIRLSIATMLAYMWAFQKILLLCLEKRIDPQQEYQLKPAGRCS